MSKNSSCSRTFENRWNYVISADMGPCKLQGVNNRIPLTGETGRLFSPLYPDAYPPNVMCTWMITVPLGRFVQLSIKSFNLEKACDYPVREIRDVQLYQASCWNLSVEEIFCRQYLPAATNCGFGFRLHLISICEELALMLHLRQLLNVRRCFNVVLHRSVYYRMCFLYPPHAPSLKSHLVFHLLFQHGAMADQIRSLWLRFLPRSTYFLTRANAFTLAFSYTRRVNYLIHHWSLDTV